MIRKAFPLSVLTLLVTLVGAGGVAAYRPNAPVLAPAGTTFTYQGSLSDGGVPANGAYDFQFSLYDALSAGGQIGSTVTKGDVTVTDGRFTVELDFGTVFDGSALWLEIGVRAGSSTGAYTTLSPRQSLTPTPYAQFALGAPWDGLTGVPAGFSDGVDNESEYWRLGFIQEGALTYLDLNGRLASTIAAFRSNQGTSNVYYIFPAPATARTVSAANYHIVDRSGAYASGTATLSLEIFNYAGILQRTVSAAGVDLEAASTGTWNSLVLSGTPADLVISPNEFLAFNFTLSTGPSGNLDVRPIFEVEVRR